MALSYGSTVGATAAAMFLDHIESMMLDGVMNQHQYWSGYDIELNAATDKIFSALLKTCLEQPAVCELAQTFPNGTTAQLEARVYGLNRLSQVTAQVPHGYGTQWDPLRLRLREILY